MIRATKRIEQLLFHKLLVEDLVKMVNHNNNSNNNLEEDKMLSFKKWGKELMIILPLYKDLWRIQFQKQLVISLWRSLKKYCSLNSITK